MPNRRQAPPLGEITQLRLAEPTKYQLDNGIPIYTFPSQHPDVVMLKILFAAGYWYEPAPLVAKLTARMLREGTRQLSAQALMATIEYYGANLKTTASEDTAQITLYTLGKHLTILLPIIHQIVTTARFDAADFQRIKQQSKQKLLLKEEKNDYLADVLFNQYLFGQKHPYGYRPQQQDFEAISIEQLKTFYKQQYTTQKCSIYLAGNINQTTLTLLNKQLGQDNWNKEKIVPFSHPILHPIPQKQVYIPKPAALQSNIRIGGRLFNKTHPDYAGCFVVNALLGGFFGSRLMTHLRENKGYTYGIYSMLSSFLHSGYWIVSTEVRSEITTEALAAIHAEIRRLQTELVSLEELELVRRYLLGNILSIIDGAFNLASTLQAIYEYNLTTDFFHQLIHTIKTIQPKTIRRLSRQYFNLEEAVQVVVGIY